MPWSTAPPVQVNASTEGRDRIVRPHRCRGRLGVSCPTPWSFPCGGFLLPLVTAFIWVMQIWGQVPSQPLQSLK